MPSAKRMRKESSKRAVASSPVEAGGGRASVSAPMARACDDASGGSREEVVAAPAIPTGGWQRKMLLPLRRAGLLEDCDIASYNELSKQLKGSRGSAREELLARRATSRKCLV